MARKTLAISEELHRWLKVEAAKQGCGLRELTEEAVKRLREHYEMAETGRGADEDRLRC